MSHPPRVASLEIFAVFLVAGATLCVPVRAQQATKPDPGKPETSVDSVAAIDGLYRKELDDIERRRLERLAVLAGKQAKDDANQTYETYFRAAIAANLFADAEPIADRVLRSKESDSSAILLADLVKIMAEVGRGAYDESLASLTSAIRLTDGAGAGVGHPLSVDARCALLDAYFQRLTQGDQFAIAKKAFTAVRDRSIDAPVKAFAASRLARLDLLGKTAPAINGNDVDGRPVRMVDMQGNVVLVVFWASWCVNNAEEVARLESVYSTFRERGFRIVGVNLDSLQDGGKISEGVRTAARHFVLEHNIHWPNLINGFGNQDYARAYAVTEIPANVLIGRDGTIVHLDLTRSNLEKVVARTVGR
jgi:peroxiredoxin